MPASNKVRGRGRMKTWLAAIPASLVMVLAGAGAAFAHDQASSFGLVNGLTHPLTGMDHFLAMVAVGIWAAQLGGRAVWAVPATFVAVMTGGALMGFEGLPIPAVELGIAGSVVVLGALVGFGARLPVAAGMAIVSAFALFHGHAHGSELPAATSAIGYSLGFVLATSALHVAGIALGLATGRFAPVTALRFGGAAISLAGLALVVAAV